MLKPQEERAIRRALPVLGSLYGLGWQPPDGSTLAELFPWKPTPECIVRNDFMTAAPEVKQLMGDAASRAYSESLISLSRKLVPSYGGRYSLWPCYGFHPPVSPQVVRMIKNEIERVGKTIPPGGEDAIRIPRSAEMTCLSKSQGSFVNCWHVQKTDEVVREIAGHVTGIYYFKDDEPTRWHHSFVTDDARSEFQARLIDACCRSDRGRPAVVHWEEEWKLTRSASSTENGVSILTMRVDWVEPGLREELQKALDQAAIKFRERWADVHLIILERIGYSNAAEEDVKRVLPSLSLPDVDLILLIDGDRVAILHARTPLAFANELRRRLGTT